MSWKYCRSAHRPTRAVVLFAWFLVAFYLLSSGRALIPGLCATQRMLDAQRDVPSCTVSAQRIRACCIPPATSESDPENSPAIPTESGCAFCKLLQSVAPVPPGLSLPPLAALAFRVPVAREAQRAHDGAPGDIQNRAPPCWA